MTSYNTSFMYGSDEIDLLVKYYDLTLGIPGKAEVTWYIEKTRKSGGPVLDLACGTGRLALLLARQGYEVTGIDQSEGMLNLFRKKLSKEPGNVQDRVRVENQGMDNFHLNQKFRTVICCDAFFHNLTMEAQMACLARVKEHLAPGGRFLFNLPNPTCEFILKCAASDGKSFEERGRYPLKDGSGTILIEQAQMGEVLKQTIQTNLRITRYDSEGKAVEVGESSWETRYLSKYEAVHLLYRCGFEILSLVGDYKDGPVTEAGQLIFESIHL